jgi:Beta-lactamase
MRTPAVAALARVAAIAAGLSLAVVADVPPPLPRAEPAAVGLQRLKLREAYALLVRYSDEHKIWSGQPLDRFLDDRLFGPLRIIDTGFWVRPEQRNRLTTVYSAGDGGGLKPSEIAILMTQSVPANPVSLRQRFKAIITQAAE